MPRTKKKKSPAECQAQFNRTTRKTGKWRGKKDYKSYKKSKSNPKPVRDKLVSQITYQKKVQ